RTLNDSFVILDEAQNTTTEQMKMFLTRLGYGSKAVVTGDVTQVDLPAGKASGLKEAQHLLRRITGIRFISFTERDVVRHPLVQEIIAADEQEGGGRRGAADRDRDDTRPAPAAPGGPRRTARTTAALRAPSARRGALADAGVRLGDAAPESRLARPGPAHRRALLRAAGRARRRTRRAPPRRRDLRRHRAPAGGRARGAAGAGARPAADPRRAAPPRVRSRALARRGAAHAAARAAARQRPRALRRTMGNVAMVGTNGATVAVAETPRRRFPVPLAALSGLLLSASFPSLEIAPLAWIGLVPLLLAIRGRSPWRAFGLGWITGTVFYLATCYWIVYTIGHYTAMPKPLAVGV